MKSKKLIYSFKYAGQGLKLAFAGEKNFRIHCLVSAVVIIFGIVFNLSAEKWVLLFLTIGFVMVCELFNTAGENLVDMITKEYSKEAKTVKDLSAGAVLISAVTAVLAGFFIFTGPVIDFLKSVLSI
jgi:undecaprenol kinase